MRQNAGNKLNRERIVSELKRGEKHCHSCDAIFNHDSFHIPDKCPRCEAYESGTPRERPFAFQRDIKEVKSVFETRQQKAGLSLGVEPANPTTFFTSKSRFGFDAKMKADKDSRPQ